MKELPINREILLKIFKYENGKLWRRNTFHGNPRTTRGEWVEMDCKERKVAEYSKIQIDGHIYLYSRVLWTFLFGEIPEGMVIDHIDGDKNNNSIDNLRIVSRRKNGQNLQMHREGRLPGTKRYKKRWRAYTSIGRNQVHLGCYDTPQEAREAVLVAEDLLSSFTDPVQFRGVVKSVLSGSKFILDK